MRRGKNWILQKRHKCKPLRLRLSLTVNLEKPLMSLYGTEWRERGYGLWWKIVVTGKPGFFVCLNKRLDCGL